MQILREWVWGGTPGDASAAVASWSPVSHLARPERMLTPGSQCGRFSFKWSGCDLEWRVLKSPPGDFRVPTRVEKS